MARKRRWRSIPSHPTYAVSDDGLVKNRISDQLLKLQDQWYPNAKTAYKRVHLFNTKSKKYHKHSVHSLVAEAFIGPRPRGHQVNHKDLNRGHNHVSNLEYVTPSRNTQHAYEMGRKPYVRPQGADSCRAKFSWKVVRQIRAEVVNGVSRKLICKKYHISKGHLSQIVNRKIYRDDMVD